MNARMCPSAAICSMRNRDLQRPFLLAAVELVPVWRGCRAIVFRKGLQRFRGSSTPGCGCDRARRFRLHHGQPHQCAAPLRSNRACSLDAKPDATGLSRARTRSQLPGRRHRADCGIPLAPSGMLRPGLFRLPRHYDFALVTVRNNVRSLPARFRALASRNAATTRVPSGVVFVRPSIANRSNSMTRPLSIAIVRRRHGRARGRGALRRSASTSRVLAGSALARLCA